MSIKSIVAVYLFLYLCHSAYLNRLSQQKKRSGKMQKSYTYNVLTLVAKAKFLTEVLKYVI